MCHELGSRGPCDEDMLWDLEPESGASECRDNATAQGIKKRVFDSIPANTARTAQAKKCYVDERGKCRQILNLRGLFGEETDLEFTHWIKTFSSLRGSGKIFLESFTIIKNNPVCDQLSPRSAG